MLAVGVLIQVKVSLGVALALHALLLLAGVLEPGAVKSAALAADEPSIDVAVDAAFAPPKTDGASFPGNPGAGGHGAPRGSAPRAQANHASAGPTKSEGGSWLRSLESAASAMATTIEEKSGAAVAGAFDGDSDGDGDGDGGGGKSKRSRSKKRGNAWGDSWDYVAGPTSHEREEVAVKADETTLPRKTIEAVVSRSSTRLKFCYDDGNRRENGLAGRIPVRFTVDSAGSVVVAVDGGSTIADPAVVRCVLSTFAAMSFPKRSTSTSVWATHVIAFPPDK